MTATIINISAVTARFLMVGEMIDRGGHLIEIVGAPIVDVLRPTHVQLVGRDLESADPTLIPFSLHRDLMVPTYDAIPA